MATTYRWLSTNYATADALFAAMRKRFGYRRASFSIGTNELHVRVPQHGVFVFDIAPGRASAGPIAAIPEVCDMPKVSPR